MEIRTVCSLRNIEVDESVYDFTYKNYFLLKGEEEGLDENIFTENLIEQGGIMTLKEFTNAPYFLCIDEGNPEDIPRIIGSHLSELNHLLNFLWLSKDSGANVSTIFSFIPDTEYLMRSSKLASYSTADGYHKSTLVTISDLITCAMGYEKLLRHSSGEEYPSSPFPNHGKPIVTDSNYHFSDYNSNTNIERCMSFFSMARTSSFLPLKISLYMSVLECLFTTDKTEVSHKVCERTALYLGKTFEEKKEIYKSIKSAYNVRSSFFHGQTLDNKNNKSKRTYLENISRNVDAILRLVLNKVLFQDGNLFNGTIEQKNEYFERLLFDQG